VSITKKIDSITEITPEYFAPVVPAPKSVKIELTPRCQYRCVFCALRTREDQPTRESDMDIEFFKRITKEMREAGVEEIGCFYLGEPFMAPNVLFQAIAWCKQVLKFPYVFVTTNGALATPRWVEACMRAGLDSLKFSINAADFEQFEKIMGVKSHNYMKALENLRLAREIRDAGGYKCGIYASSIRFDGDQQEKMDALLKEHVIPFVDEHYFLPLYSMAMRSAEIEQKLGYKPMHGNSGRFDTKTGLPTRTGLPCWALFTEGHVRSDGHLSACCFGSDQRFDVGDLNKQSFMDAWNGEAMRDIRTAHIKAKTEGPEALKGSFCEVCVAYG
jgi:MoaA/NifB/PqqE/SkfB family radical SAM enzyme